MTIQAPSETPDTEEGSPPEHDRREDALEPTDASEPGGSTARAWHWPDRRTVGLHAAVVGAFLAMSVLLWWRVWVTGHPTSTVTCGCGDISEELWYLAWPPWAVTHGHNPFLSNAIFVGQGGVNMLANTTFMAFGTLFAPITWLFGPVATLNVALTLAPVVSGWCCFLALRKVTTFVPGQVLAAALYGFSPNIVAGNGVLVAHLFLAWAFLPPLVFLCLYDLFVEHLRGPVLVGAALGLLVVLQFFTSTEMLAIFAVVAVVAVLAAFMLAPRVALSDWRRWSTGLGVAVVVAGVVLAYPVWFALAGPRHTVGPAWAGTTYLAAKIGDLVQAGPHTHDPGGIMMLSGYFGPGGPNPDYLGIAVVAFIALSAVVWYRSRLAWVAVVTFVVSWLLSLGPQIQPLRASTNGIWLPFRALEHLPALSAIIPVRFSVVMDFAAAVLVALSADGWWRQLRRHRPHRLGRVAMVGGATVLTALVTATLVPVAGSYTVPYVVHDQPEPAWFADAAPRLPAGTAVAVVPYPSGLPGAMGWLAQDGMRFRLLGGYAIVPGRDGRHSAGVSPFGGGEAALIALSNPLVGRLPGADRATLGAVRDLLARRGVQVVVVTTLGRDPVYAAGFLTAALGRAPRIEHGAWVWYGVGSAKPLALAPGALERCASSADALPSGAASIAAGSTGAATPAVPACVLASAA